MGSGLFLDLFEKLYPTACHLLFRDVSARRAGNETRPGQARPGKSATKKTFILFRFPGFSF